MFSKCHSFHTDFIVTKNFTCIVSNFFFLVFFTNLRVSNNQCGKKKKKKTNFYLKRYFTLWFLCIFTPNLSKCLIVLKFVYNTTSYGDYQKRYFIPLKSLNFLTQSSVAARSKNWWECCFRNIFSLYFNKTIPGLQSICENHCIYYFWC